MANLLIKNQQLLACHSLLSDSNSEHNIKIGVMEEFFGIMFSGFVSSDPTRKRKMESNLYQSASELRSSKDKEVKSKDYEFLISEDTNFEVTDPQNESVAYKINYPYEKRLQEISRGRR